MRTPTRAERRGRGRSPGAAAASQPPWETSRDGLRRLAFFAGRLWSREELRLEPEDPGAFDIEHGEAQAVREHLVPGLCGPPDQIDIVKKLVELLDIAVQQVSIKAEFITVSDGDSQAMGLNWSMSTLNSSIASDIGGTGEGPTITIGVAQGNLDATLTALRQRSRARTLLAPLISTLNNVPATIYTAESYPVFQPSIVQGGTSGGGNIVTYTPSYITATTGLDVLPRINRDGSVTVQIQPQVTQFTRNVTGPNNITLPVTVQQTLRTVRRVKSGESIVLGGLANKTLSKTTRGIPFLEDLPFVGRFFRSNDDRVTDSQLLIFLTPTIVEETGGAQLSPG